MSNASSGLLFDPITAIAHLVDNDSGLKSCVCRVGNFNLSVCRNRSVFEYLVRSIVYQQLTGKAASAIHSRLLAQFPYGRISPSQLLSLTFFELKSVGLSRSKCRSLHDLAERASKGYLPKTSELRKMNDDQIVTILTEIWGIGRWTAEMLLIFYLGRPDVLPISDLGIRKGYQKMRGYSALPSLDKLSRAGQRWRPYRTVASWYLWKSLDV